jgi:hypothetical protein
MLFRGKVEALSRRLDRISTVIDEDEFAGGDKQLPQEAAKWREQVADAYLAEARKSPDAAAKMQALWAQDEYLGHLLQFDVDDIPRTAKKTTLTKLILAAVREPLRERTGWLFATLTQDKAQRTSLVWSVQKAAGKSAKTAADHARGEWSNAERSWRKYLDRGPGPNPYTKYLPVLKQRVVHGDDLDPALAFWEHLQKDLHQYAAARLELAQAMRRLGKDPTAMLDQLVKDLENVVNDKALAAARAEAPNTGILQAFDGPLRWSLLMRDWEPDGSIAWLIESARRAKDGK